MPAIQVLQTPRLHLRDWRTDDLPAYAAMNADPQVTEFLPAFIRAESDQRVARIREHFSVHGFGQWAVELIDGGTFIGSVGLSVASFQSHFTPCVEVGWRLAYEHWGRGYATEAATAAIDFGFETLKLDEIVSFTVPENLRSRRVMERLGMTRSEADDFEHPLLAKGHRLRRHVLYRLSRSHSPRMTTPIKEISS
jgi:RimJ/RimL family protein N-acetyltransferase